MLSLEKSFISLEKEISTHLKDVGPAIKNLADKIETLTSLHLKIIYWLLIVVSVTLAGVKGAEVVHSFTNFPLGESHNVTKPSQ